MRWSLLIFVVVAFMLDRIVELCGCKYLGLMFDLIGFDRELLDFKFSNLHARANATITTMTNSGCSMPGIQHAKMCRTARWTLNKHCHIVSFTELCWQLIHLWNSFRTGSFKDFIRYRASARGRDAMKRIPHGHRALGVL